MCASLLARVRRPSSPLHHRQIPVRMPRWTLIVVALGVSSCDSAVTAPSLGALQGHWLWGPEALQPVGSWTQEFVVHASGRTENRIVSRGSYAGQGPSEVSATQVLYGRIAVRDDRFVVHPDSEVIEDRFYGPRHRNVRTSGIAWWVTDSVLFDVRDNTLTVSYLIYPADAPVRTTLVYRRAP
jgi:hypothetical protein